MTAENRKENIKAELAKAREALCEADLLHSGGLSTGAVSRLYYFLLHTVRALLLSKGIEPKSHEGVLRTFGLYFIKEDVFEAKFSHIFSKLMKYREEADYNPSFSFSGDDYKTFKKEAEEITTAIEDYLKKLDYV